VLSCLLGLLSRGGAERRECSSGVSKTKRFILSLDSGFSEPFKRGDWEESLSVVGAPALGIRRTLERLARGLKASGMLKFVTVFFPVPRPFAPIAETGGFGSV